MITLTVDAMSRDTSLVITVPGAVSFLKQQSDVHLIMIDDEAAVRQALSSAGTPMDRITVCHTAQIVEMSKAPQSALKNKKESSMRIAINQVKEGSAQAAVSAGNTDALIATARFVLKTVPGIECPAITRFLSSNSEHVTLALDLGANVDCIPEQLVQFVIIDSELVHALRPEEGSPRVALLNVGTEDIRGTDAAKQTFKLLSSSKLDFVGNVGNSSVLCGEADAVVADGFVGNVMLKTIKGAVKFMNGAIRREFQNVLFNKLAAIAALPALEGLKGKPDLRKLNGAILLDLHGAVIKSHGGTDEVGSRYALEEAYHEAKPVDLAQIEQDVTIQLAALEAAKVEAEQEGATTPATEAQG